MKKFHAIYQIEITGKSSSAFNEILIEQSIDEVLQAFRDAIHTTLTDKQNRLKVTITPLNK